MVFNEHTPALVCFCVKHVIRRDGCLGNVGERDQGLGGAEGEPSFIRNVLPLKTEPAADGTLATDTNAASPVRLGCRVFLSVVFPLQERACPLSSRRPLGSYPGTWS